jgi:hypothetical protein
MKNEYLRNIFFSKNFLKYAVISLFGGMYYNKDDIIKKLNIIFEDQIKPSIVLNSENEKYFWNKVNDQFDVSKL